MPIARLRDEVLQYRTSRNYSAAWSCPSGHTWRKVSEQSCNLQPSSGGNDPARLLKSWWEKQG